MRWHQWLLENSRIRIIGVCFDQGPVADPDLQIRGGGGGGGGHPDSEKRGEASPRKNFFRPFGPQFGVKLRRGTRAPPLDPPLRATNFSSS